MPKIMPITELRNTKKITQICDEEQAPVFITSNGYNKLVVMTDEVYNKTLFLFDVYKKLHTAEEQIKNGEVVDAKEALDKMREKYGF